MSLSFVSKAVLTVKEGGGYEETAVESKESVGSSSRVTTSQPLFEQLRANREQEEMEREEFQKSIMRGTLALDEEDCAHLDALQKQRQEREMEIRRQTQSELEAFRAAQAVNRIEQGMKEDNDDDDGYDEDDNRKREDDLARRQHESEKHAVPAKPQFPKIVSKRRRKVPAETAAAAAAEDDTCETKKARQGESLEASELVPAEKPGLSVLLAGYGSDSD